MLKCDLQFRRFLSSEVYRFAFGIDVLGQFSEATHFDFDFGFWIESNSGQALNRIAAELGKWFSCSVFRELCRLFSEDLWDEA